MVLNEKYGLLVPPFLSKSYLLSYAVISYSGTVYAHNQALLTCFNLSENLLGKNIFEYIHHTFHKSVEQLVANAVNGANQLPAAHTQTILFKSQQLNIKAGMEISLLTHTEDGPTLLCLFNKMVQDKDTINNVIKQLPGTIFEFRMHKDGSFTMPYVGDNVLQNFGFNASELRSSADGLFSRIHKDDLPKIIHQIAASAKELTKWKEEYRIINANGTISWVLSESMPEKLPDGSIVWCGYMMNITDQKLAQEKLVKQRGLIAKLSLVAQQVTNCIILTNSNGDIDWVNEAFCKWYNTNHLLVKGKNILKFFYDAYPNFAKQQLTLNTIVDKPIEVAFLVNENGKKWVRITCYPISEQGIFLGYYISQQDITQDKEQAIQLQNNIDRLSLILSSAKMGTWEITLKDNHISFDDRTKELYGHAGQANITTVSEWEQLILKEDLESIQVQIADAVKNTGEFHAQYRVWQQDGTIRYLEGHATIVKNSAGLASKILGISWDITEKTESQQQILFQSKLLNTVEEAVIVYNEDNKITFFNNFAENLYGYAKEEVLHTNASFLMPNSDEELLQITNTINSTLKEGKGWNGELIVQNKAGVQFPVLCVCSPIFNDFNNYKGFIAISYDISIQKNAQKVLQESVNRLSAFVEHLPVGAMIITDDNISFNKSVEQITGYSRTEITNLDTWFSKLCGDDALIVKSMYEHDKHNSFNMNRHVQIIRKDGSIRWVDFAAYSDEVIEIWVMYDVTERKLGEAQILNQNERLRQIAYMQSHEVRRPLSNIMGLINLIIEDHENNKLAYLKLLAESCEDLDGVIKKVVNKSRN